MWTLLRFSRRFCNLLPNFFVCRHVDIAIFVSEQESIPEELLDMRLGVLDRFHLLLHALKFCHLGCNLGLPGLLLELFLLNLCPGFSSGCRSFHQVAWFSLGNRDGGGLMEDSRNVWVHGDHVVALQGHPLISPVDLCIYPILEILPHDGVNNISQVSPAELLNFLAWWQCLFNISVILSKVEYVLDCQAFELRNFYDLDIVTVDNCLHPHGQVTKVPNGDCFIARQICPNFWG